MKALHLPAPAKLNLMLQVLGRRRDGYHDLQTLFHAISLQDELWLLPTAAEIGLSISAERPELLVAGGEDNLVVRALQALRQASGYTGGFRAHLHKRIPAGAGLGGGSSDAAAALRLANALLPAPLAAAELARLAVRLGADVPFFLCGGSQWGSGVGEQLVAANVDPAHFVLILPPFGCATAAVFQIHAAQWKAGAPQASMATNPVPPDPDSVPNMKRTVERMEAQRSSSAAALAALGNALVPAAEQLRPELRCLRERVAQLGYPAVYMSGSGSTLFLVMPDAVAAAACAQALRPLAVPAPTGAGVQLLLANSAGPAAVPELADWPAGQVAAAGQQAPGRCSVGRQPGGGDS